MNAQQLKNSILQMAVQGKLVPQDPNDEPASVLLERIRAEKEKLIKEGKNKKEKNPSYIFRGEDNLPYEKVGKNEPVCIADEVPFEIPDCWEWVRLGNIGETNIGLTYRPSDKTDSSGTLVLRSSNIQDGKMDYSDCVYVSCDVPERAMISKGDILICARNGSRSLVGKCAIVDGNGMAFGAFMAKFSSIFNPYIKVFIDSPIFRGQLEGVKTETINQITQDMLKKQLIPLPPQNEQKRIVEALSVVQTYVDKYDKKETELSDLNSFFHDMLKKSILQQAVMGKLVPQDHNDEPASVILDQIRAEKQKLVIAGKLKKDKHESIIYRRDNSHYEKLDGVERCIDNEIPFEIPESWSWSRLSSVCSTLTCGYASTPEYVSKEIGKPFISAKNVKPYRFLPDEHKYIRPELFNSLREGCCPERGDILLTRVGAGIGEAAIIDCDLEFAIYVSLTLIKLVNYDLLNNEYILFWLNSPIGIAAAAKNTFGKDASQGNLNVKNVRNYLVPIPPMKEQKRIVAKINEILSITIRL